MKLACITKCLKFIALISVTTMVGVCKAEAGLSYVEGEPTDTINIVAYKNPDRRPYKAFIRAMESNEKFKTLAPMASVNFQLVSLLDKGLDFQNIRLRFVGENVNVPIVLSENGLFHIEKNFEKDADNAELIVSVKSGTSKFTSSVRTPALPSNERRLGDLRLECEMNWAMTKEDLPFVMKAAFALGGGLCHSSKIAVSFSEPKRFKTIWLVDSDRKLKIFGGQSGNRYAPPLHDQSWGDDAKLVFEYDDEVIAGSQ